MHADPWGLGQTRNTIADHRALVNFLWAYENPRPRKAVVAIRFEPVAGTLIVSGISAGNAQSSPLRWERRRKAVLTLPKSVRFDYTLDHEGRLDQIRLDLGQVISAARVCSIRTGGGRARDRTCSRNARTGRWWWSTPPTRTPVSTSPTANSCRSLGWRQRTPGALGRCDRSDLRING